MDSSSTRAQLGVRLCTFVDSIQANDRHSGVDSDVKVSDKLIMPVRLDRIPPVQRRFEESPRKSLYMVDGKKILEKNSKVGTGEGAGRKIRQEIR